MEKSKVIKQDSPQIGQRIKEILHRPGANSAFIEEVEKMGGEEIIPVLKRGPAHDIMRLVNTKTSKTLVEIDKLFDDFFPRTKSEFPGVPTYDVSKAPQQIRDLFLDKLPRLMVENLDIEKSVKRGFRDMIKGEPLKSEMFRKIKSDLIDPLKEYLSNPDSEFSKNTDYQEIREQMLEKLNQIEAKHFGVQKSSRGG